VKENVGSFYEIKKGNVEIKFRVQELVPVHQHNLISSMAAVSREFYHKGAILIFLPSHLNHKR